MTLRLRKIRQWSPILGNWNNKILFIDKPLWKSTFFIANFLSFFRFFDPKLCGLSWSKICYISWKLTNWGKSSDRIQLLLVTKSICQTSSINIFLRLSLFTIRNLTLLKLIPGVCWLLSCGKPIYFLKINCFLQLLSYFS